MQLPLIHLNGTSKDSLVEDLCNASQALNDAYDALKRTAPNGRDYYPLGAIAFEKAIAEHNERLRSLDAIKAEIDALTTGIYDQ